jgi:hypothetical protein
VDAVRLFLLVTIAKVTYLRYPYGDERLFVLFVASWLTFFPFRGSALPHQEKDDVRRANNKAHKSSLIRITKLVLPRQRARGAVE